MELQEIFDYVKNIVKKYYKNYHKYYLNNSIDYKDLIQEADIVSWQLLKNIKNGKVYNKADKQLEVTNIIEVKRYIGKAVGRKLNELRKKSEKASMGTNKGEMLCQCPIITRDGFKREEVDGYCSHCGLPLGQKQEVDYCNEDNDNYIETGIGTQDSKIQITIDEVTEICNNNPKIKPEYFKMFMEHTIEGTTFRDLGIKYKISHVQVKMRVDKVTKILRDIYLKEIA